MARGRRGRRSKHGGTGSLPDVAGDRGRRVNQRKMSEGQEGKGEGRDEKVLKVLETTIGQVQALQTASLTRFHNASETRAQATFRRENVG